MTSNRPNRDDRLREIIEEAKRPDTDIGALIAEAIPLLGNERLKPQEWTSLQHDRDGFKNQIGIDYYLREPLDKYDCGYLPYNGMAHRQRPGRLVVLKADGTQSDVTHELAKREEFFIGAPISQIQQLAQMPGHTSLVELSDLTEYIGQQEGGKIALVLDKSHLDQIVRNTRNALATLIDLAITPGRREALEAALKKDRGL